MPSAPSGTSVRRSWSIAYDRSAWTGMSEHSERLMWLAYLLFDLSTRHQPGLNSKNLLKCVHLLCMNTVQSPSWLKYSPIPELKQHCAHSSSPLTPISQGLRYLQLHNLHPLALFTSHAHSFRTRRDTSSLNPISSIQPQGRKVTSVEEVHVLGVRVNECQKVKLNDQLQWYN